MTVTKKVLLKVLVTIANPLLITNLLILLAVLLLYSSLLTPKTLN
jgi:hypothetical protein